MRWILEEGIEYPLEDISEEERKNDLEYMMRRGNHKSSMEPRVNAETLKENYGTEVRRGWMLPISMRCLQKVRGAGVIPVGKATQYTVDDKGKRKIKRRTTHDASFPPPSNKSVNLRM